MTPNIIDAAKRYAAANPSDPFAFRRAMSQAANGVALYRDRQGKDRLAFDAKPVSERRFYRRPTGEAVAYNWHGYRAVSV